MPLLLFIPIPTLFNLRYSTLYLPIPIPIPIPIHLALLPPNHPAYGIALMRQSTQNPILSIVVPIHLLSDVQCLRIGNVKLLHPFGHPAILLVLLPTQMQYKLIDLLSTCLLWVVVLLVSVQVIKLYDGHVWLVFISAVDEPGWAFMGLAGEDHFDGVFGCLIIPVEDAPFEEVVLDALAE